MKMSDTAPLRVLAGLAAGVQRQISKPLPSTVSAVVLDCDGLLVDTEAAWRRAQAAMCAARGVAFGSEQRAELTGRTAEEAAALLRGWFGATEGVGDLVREMRFRVDLAGAETPRALPGALELVRLLADRVPLGIASNSGRSALDASLSAAGLAQYFAVTVSADDVLTPKPDPLAYLTAFVRLGAEPWRGVVLEDSRAGATAARAAGAYVVAVPSTPGTAMPNDRVVASLRDADLLAWAGSVRSTTVREQPAAVGSTTPAA